MKDKGLLDFLFDEDEYIYIEFTRSKIDEFKELIEEVDDCLFMKIVEELEKYSVNLKKFDEWLNKDELDEHEKIMLNWYIAFTRSIAKEILEDKIDSLIELHEKL